jgi:hypothetical protein
MLQNDELLQRIGYLERGIRFWKGLAFALGTALFLFLALGTALGVSLYLQNTKQQADIEIMMREEMLARQRAVEAQKAAEKAAEKSPW